MALIVDRICIKSNSAVYDLLALKLSGCLLKAKACDMEDTVVVGCYMFVGYWNKGVAGYRHMEAVVASIIMCSKDCCYSFLISPFLEFISRSYINYIDLYNYWFKYCKISDMIWDKFLYFHFFLYLIQFKDYTYFK